MLIDNQSMIIKPEMSLKLVLEISMLTHERGLMRGWDKTQSNINPPGRFLFSPVLFIGEGIGDGLTTI